MFNPSNLSSLTNSYRPLTPPPQVESIELGSLTITTEPGQLGALEVTVRQSAAQVDVQETIELIENERRQQAQRSCSDNPGLDMACVIFGGPAVSCPGLAIAGTFVKTAGLLAANPCGAAVLLVTPIAAGAALPVVWITASQMYKESHAN
jgi:hypothetical protein